MCAASVKPTSQSLTFSLCPWPQVTQQTTTTTTTTQCCPASGMKGNPKAPREAVFVCDKVVLVFFVKILHFQHNIMKKSTIVAALQAQTQLTCSNFIKLEDRCMATHYFPCEAWRNKPCLQTSPCSALGSVFMLLSRSPASSHHTGDSRARLWAALRSSLCVSVRLQPETHE